MKRKLFLISILVICVSSLAAGSLAYFTAEDRAHNVITTGSVSITLHEWKDLDKTPYEAPGTILPGAVVDKIAVVENTGPAEAWIRVKVTTKILDSGGEALNPSLIELDLNTADWTELDGYLYYNHRLGPGEYTTPIFTTVTFSTDMDNDYKAANAIVDVSAQAVQTAHNSDLDPAERNWPV